MKAIHLLIGFSVLGKILILLTACQNEMPAYSTTPNSIDSIIRLYSTEKPASEAYLKQALEKVAALETDSLKIAYYTEIAYLLASSKDSLLFREANNSALVLAEKEERPEILGEVYWHYGIHYLKRLDYGKSYLYYEKAFKQFKGRDAYYSAKMLYNMALIRTYIKDYTGGEVLGYQAIGMLIPLKKYKQLYLCHNLLGAIYDNLQEYSQAQDHYRKAMDYLKLSGSNGIARMDIENNLGVLYQKMGKQDKALELFEAALANENLLKEDSALYARILDNRAQSLFLLGNQTVLPGDFYKALLIRERIAHPVGMVMSHIHLAEYHLYQKDSLAAIGHAKQAYELGKSLTLNRDALSALRILAKADRVHRATYLDAHIGLNDTLNQMERQVRDKFTRIAFETDSYIEENKRLARDKIIIVGGATAVVLILLLLIANYNVRAKNKALAFETEQQKANEKIYLLTLKQQENLAKGQLQERRRISEDLHDGILARLFGIRMNWGFLNIEGSGGAITKHRGYLQELQQIEKEIRDISHDLRNELYVSENQYIKNLSALVKKWEKQGKFSAELKIVEEATWERINSYLKTNIYKIMEEALHNIVQHARAKKVKLVLKANNSFLHLYIEDDGIGYSKRFAEPGIGIKNIKSRTKKMGGTCMIEGIPYKGTKIYISIPIKY
jgi:signal transduction histidine kinase